MTQEAKNPYPVWSEELRFAIHCAKEAGNLVKERASVIPTLSWKSRTDFKTQVDDECDTLIRCMIGEKYPHDTIYSEENLAKVGTSRRSWVVDPLDGTIPFAYQINNHSSICIALTEKDTQGLGVIYAMCREELYVAELGKGAFLNDIPIHVSDDAILNKALVAIDFGKIDRLRPISHLISLLQPDGANAVFSSLCASVNLAYVASGRIHMYLAGELEPWDMAAAVVILREAGGKVTNLEGEEWRLKHSSILTANPHLHKIALQRFDTEEMQKVLQALLQKIQREYYTK